MGPQKEQSRFDNASSYNFLWWIIRAWRLAGAKSREGWFSRPPRSLESLHLGLVGWGGGGGVAN